MANRLRVWALSQDGMCVVWVSGELDLITADEFAERVTAAVQRIDGPVVADLSGLAFIDARGGRVMGAAFRALPGGRSALVRSCPPQIRLVLDTLGLYLNYVPADYLTAEHRAAPASATRDLVHQVQRARLHAGQARLGASWMLAQLTDTYIRLASTRERLGLIREQGQQRLATSRAVREEIMRSRRDGILRSRREAAF
jgi:anti-anti-sigma factor